MGNVIVSILLILAVSFAIRLCIRSHRSGSHSCDGCTGNCAGCHRDGPSDNI